MTGEPCTIVSRAPSTSAVTGAESASMRTGEAKQPSFDPDVEVGIVTVADETCVMTSRLISTLRRLRLVPFEQDSTHRQETSDRVCSPYDESVPDCLRVRAVFW